MESKNLILLRGLPGAGKSSLANVLSENGHYPVFAIDNYFTNKITGEYQFNFAENYLAYQQCENLCKQALLEGITKVFIDNTFTLDWELAPYFKLAAQFDYMLYVITVEKYHDQTNLHGVNQEQLEKMAEKYKVKLL
jgi:predicted kinase